MQFVKLLVKSCFELCIYCPFLSCSIQEFEKYQNVSYVLLAKHSRGQGSGQGSGVGRVGRAGAGQGRGRARAADRGTIRQSDNPTICDGSISLTRCNRSISLTECDGFISLQNAMALYP